MTISTKKPLYAEVNNVPDDYEFTNEELNRIIAGDMFTPRQDAIMAREIQKLRAAMLNGDEPVSQTYKLPVNTPCQDAPANIWLQTAGVWPEDGELSELTWCSHNQHHDDTLYVRADLVNGNSPVTPDGYADMLQRWLVFGIGMLKAGSQLPRDLIAETKAMVAALQQEDE